MEITKTISISESITIDINEDEPIFCGFCNRLALSVDYCRVYKKQLTTIGFDRVRCDQCKHDFGYIKENKND